jgi:hypothetical protein
VLNVCEENQKYSSIKHIQTKQTKPKTLQTEGGVSRCRSWYF